MEKKLFIITICLMLFVMTSCEDDYVVEKPLIESSMFQGEWYSEDNNTYLNFNYSSYSGSVYMINGNTAKIGENITGKWMLYPENNRIRLDAYYSESNISDTRDYKVISINEKMMILLDLALGSQYQYHRVTRSYNLYLGDRIDVVKEGYKTTTSSSTSPSVVKINNEVITAIGSGDAYIRIDGNVDYTFIKVNVLPRPICYAVELLSTIDEILKKYGEPDGKAESNNSPSLVIGWGKTINDSSLNYIHYLYDEQSREITEIKIIYKSEEDFDVDSSYIRQEFHDLQDGTYGLEPFLGNNSFTILFDKSKHGLTMLFSNMDYFLHHNYF